MERPIHRVKVLAHHAAPLLQPRACGDTDDDVNLDSLAYGFMASQAGCDMMFYLPLITDPCRAVTV